MNNQDSSSIHHSEERNPNFYILRTLDTLGPGPMYSYQNDLVQGPSPEVVSKLRRPEFSGGTWRQPLRSFEVE